MEWWNLLSSIVTILTLLGVGIKVGSWIKGVSTRFDDVENRLKNVELNTGWLLFIHREEPFKLYDKFYPPHRSNLSEKDMLLAKLREGTITPQEAEKLKPLLEKQRAEAFASGSVGAAIVIGGLLLLLAIISALAGEKQKI